MAVLELPSVGLIPPPPFDDRVTFEAGRIAASDVNIQILQDIEASVERRFKHLLAVESGGPEAIKLELAICAQDALYWLHWYGWTYDPRNPLEVPALPAHLPFDLCQRQIELWEWFEFILNRRQDGCVKKSRGIGFTWEAGALAWHKWRFVPGFKTAFGSRKATEVDQIGNPDSILEKIRMLYRALPKWMLPIGFNPALHDKQMLLINPQNDNTIRGEGGDEMGRGGRSTLYIIDEASKIEHADRVEAATSANAGVRIWGSTINPQNENNLFARKYNASPPERVFRFHYSEHPIWTPERIANKKADSSPEVWASEFEIDDSYTVEDICIPQAWVKSAVALRRLLSERVRLEHERGTGEASKYKLQPRIEGVVGGDVGGGKAASVAVGRFGAVVTKPSAWGNPDTIDTAFKMLDYCVDLRIEKRDDNYQPVVRVLRYDSIAIGQGVTATLKRNPRPGLIIVGHNTGEAASETKWPDGEYANEKFFNSKAEGWWTVRERCKFAHELALFLQDQEGGAYHAPDDCLSLPDDPNDQLTARLLAQLSQVKWMRRENGKIQMESKATMSTRGVPSPDYADALVLTCVAPSKAEKWIAFAKVNIGA